MFEAPHEARMAAGYLLALGFGIVVYMRFAFTRQESDVSVRSSVSRIVLCGVWGGAVVVYIVWPDLVRHWNFFMFSQIRWGTTGPAIMGVLLIVWAMRSHLRSAEDGSIDAGGLYAWCRYPLDAAIGVFMVSVTLLCANWLLIALTMVLLCLHRLAIPYEVERYRHRLLGCKYDEYAARTGWFLPTAAPIKKSQYQVPSRFGLTAIMGLLTVLAFIFGALHAVEAPPAIYLFVGSEILAICLVQILVGSSPRGGSTLTGAVLLPFWVYMTLRTPSMPLGFEFVFIGSLVAFGGLLGYCIGALAAGFFLMIDLIEPWLIRDAAAYPLRLQDPPTPHIPVDSD
ncbi:MAG: hypothetical protein H6822_26500 [Planctomycetaceae bacterium]|nr:hypothetical protein [Planctomycetales bacterium]MCB9925729.1 hypothetical protein [Planctomycetaceae bacterium]